MVKDMLLNGFAAVCFSFAVAAHGQTALTPNMIRDGGMEKWREVGPDQPQHNSLKNLQVSFTDTNSILMPSAYEQGGISVVQRESSDVFSGKYSLRLKSSRFYMLSAYESAYYDVRQGDIFVVRFMAKGKGDARMRLEVYSDRGHLGGAYTLEQKGTPVPDRWTLIEQRILVGQPSPTKIYPGLETISEMLIDDIFIGRVLREDEQMDIKKVPKEYDERIAFAPAASQAPVIDGKLDEECWKPAVAFSGFRVAGEQMLLVPEQSSFRTLYDEKAIYLGIEIMLADAERILNDLKASRQKDEKAGDLYTDRHSVEIFVQPPGQARYIQCAVSLDGYRYDGVALDNSWNGRWTYGISAGKDRWCLEVMIPASDLNLEKIESSEGWRINIVDNREGNYSTWAAVGNNFHNPFNFGTLVTKDFVSWRQEKLQGWDEIKKKAAEGADKYGLAFADRLSRTGEFSKTLIQRTSGQDKPDWETVTRVYAMMNFVDTVYRVMDAEMAYAQYFAGR